MLGRERSWTTGLGADNSQIPISPIKVRGVDKIASQQFFPKVLPICMFLEECVFENIFITQRSAYKMTIQLSSHSLLRHIQLLIRVPISKRWTGLAHQADKYVPKANTLISVSLHDLIHRKIHGFCEVLGKTEISLWSPTTIKAESEAGRSGDSWLPYLSSSDFCCSAILLFLPNWAR